LVVRDFTQPHPAGRGWTNGEIAERLVLSDSTVKTYVGPVLAKLEARDRIQAVILATHPSKNS